MLASLEHAQEEDLERYSIGTLSGPQGEALEEHLLICPACQDQLAEVDAYVRTVRVAASRLRSKTPLSHPRIAGSGGSSRSPRWPLARWLPRA